MRPFLLSSNLFFTYSVQQRLSFCSTIFMTHKKYAENLSKKTISTKVDKFQKLLMNSDSSSSADGWDKCWEQGLTPWDLGQPTPILVHLHEINALPKGRVLIPGCGSGYDVAAIACPERYVVGLDISENAIKKAKERQCSSPNADYFTFLKADFFTWRPTELFDLIFDYTFFCAIEPKMRSAWGMKMKDLLKPNGELITLMFPTNNQEEGSPPPPYKVTVSDYEEVLNPLGFKAISILDNKLAIPPRKGREVLGKWKKSFKISSL